MPQERICNVCLAYMYLHTIPGWLRCPSCAFHKKEKNSMISTKEMLGDVKFEDLPNDLQTNTNDLLIKVNKFRSLYGQPMIVTSGYRSSEHNAAIGGAKDSAHCQCQAIDFKDDDNALKEWILKDPSVLEECELYMECPTNTPNWVHLQSRVIKSGNRIFKP